MTYLNADAWDRASFTAAQCRRVDALIVVRWLWVSATQAEALDLARWILDGEVDP